VILAINKPNPKSPPSEDILKFEVDRVDGPIIEDIRLNWGKPLNTIWNKEAIGLLALDFIKKVEDREILLNSNRTMDANLLIPLITRKLVRTWTKLHIIETSNGEDHVMTDIKSLSNKERRQKMDRRTSRRKGVSHWSPSM
jgi:hypothetical protein